MIFVKSKINFKHQMCNSLFFLNNVFAYGSAQILLYRDVIGSKRIKCDSIFVYSIFMQDPYFHSK